MELWVYNGEIFDRKFIWYFRFFIILLLLSIISIINNNAPGAIILLFIMGGYFYYSNTANKKILLKIEENGINIGGKVHSRNNMIGYVLEVSKIDGKIKNIVFVGQNNHYIHTIYDDIEKLKIFIENLENYIKMQETYQQTFREKIMRKLQI